MLRQLWMRVALIAFAPFFSSLGMFIKSNIKKIKNGER